MITIIKDKDPIWDVENFDVVLVGTSIYCMLTSGFQSKIRFKYPIVDKENDKTGYGDRRKLGRRITVEIGDEQPVVSLAYIATYPNSRRCFLDYAALENCLKTANAEFKGKKVVTTVLGSSKFDGNGDKDKCLKMIEELTPDLDLYVYDYNQLSHTDEVKRQKKYIYSFRKTDREKYNELVALENEILKKLYLA